MKAAKIVFAAWLILIAAASAFAQQIPSPSTNVSTQQLTLLPQNPVAPVTTVQFQPSQGGNSTFYYWFVSHDGSGNVGAPAGPFLSNFTTTPSASYPTTIRFTFPYGIVSVDILRLSAPGPPSGACSCAVATGIVSAVVSDNVATTTAYTVSTSANQIPTILTNTFAFAGAWANLALSGTNTGTGMALAPTSAGTAFSITAFPGSDGFNFRGTTGDIIGHISGSSFEQGGSGLIVAGVQQITASNYSTANASGTSNGNFNLASGDSIHWRNNAGSADVALAKNASDALTWNGNVIATTSGPVGSPAIAVDLTAQGANIGATTLVTPGANGYYEYSCYIVITQAATTSSTLPACNVSYTDADSGVVKTIPATATQTTNSVGAIGAYASGQILDFPVVIYAKSGTAIQYSTTGYVTSGATSMQYALHIRLRGPQ
jgi:hypothetical protein